MRLRDGRALMMQDSLSLRRPTPDGTAARRWSSVLRGASFVDRAEVGQKHEAGAYDPALHVAVVDPRLMRIGALDERVDHLFTRPCVRMRLSR